MERHVIKTEDAAATRSLGERLAACLFPGSVVLLCGEMGAGKTEFVKGVARGLGVEDSVTSPTYALVNVYGNGDIYHFDLHRLSSYGELQMSGADAYLYEKGVSLIEWPDIARDYLPEGYIEVTLNKLPQPEARDICVCARGKLYCAALAGCAL